MINYKTEFFLALKYFKPKRNAISVITLISVIGVMLGVTVLIVVWAVMTGFTDLMKAKLLETTAHIQVDNPYYSCIRKPERIVKIAKECGAEATPIVQNQVLVQSKKRVWAKIVFGIEPGYKNEAIDIAKKIKPGDGAYSLERNEILISTVTAREIGVGVGDKMLLHSPHNLAKMVEVKEEGKVELNKNAKYFLPREFVVSGIFNFGKYDFDKNILFISLDDADELFGYPWGAATNVYVWTKDPFNMEGVLAKMSKKLPEYRLLTWKDMNRHILGVLAVEKNMMFFLLIFIVLVAAFSITNTLITMVIQKTREIGLLKALGVDEGSIMRIFLYQGFFVGIAGSFLGTSLGIGVVFFRNKILKIASAVTGQDLFPPEFYFFNELPAKIIPEDIVLIVCVSIILCTIGGIIPALRAARLDAAKSLSYE